MWPKWARMSFRATFGVYSCWSGWKDHFRDVSAEKVLRGGLWNREKFETWPKSRVALCVAAWIPTGKRIIFFNIFSKYICEVKVSVCDFLWPDLKGSIVISELALLQIPLASAYRESVLLVVCWWTLDLNSFNFLHKYIQRQLYECHKYQGLRIEK